MSAIEVLEPGLLTTVQDLGREGFGPLGVSASGAADAVALRVGNRLVGNPGGASAVEMTLVGGTFRFRGNAIAALTGSDFGATLDGVAIAPWSSFRVRAGQTLRIGASREGARCMLCVGGGMKVPLVLGSASTHLRSGLGGVGGRAVRRGDLLRIGVIAKKSAAPAQRPAMRTISTAALQRFAPRKILRVTDGPQSDWFTTGAQRVCYTQPYQVTEASDRMGLRLQGAQIEMRVNREMITEGVSLGAIQVPASGQPIIVFVDQQTTGGYAKIANVISADMHSVGQLRPRDEIRFERVSLDTARSLYVEQEALLASEELFAH